MKLSVNYFNQVLSDGRALADVLPHTVRRDDWNTYEVIPWCTDHLGTGCLPVATDDFYFDDTGNWDWCGRTFYFKNECDAMLFKLRWP